VTKHRTEDDWNVKPQYRVDQEPLRIALSAPGASLDEPAGEEYDSQDDFPPDDPDDPSSEDVTSETFDRLRWLLKISLLS
jgi:hypothetical protein